MRTQKTDITDKLVSPDLLRKINAYLHVASYLQVSQIYLYNDPLLKRQWMLKHIKLWVR